MTVRTAQILADFPTDVVDQKVPGNIVILGAPTGMTEQPDHADPKYRTPPSGDAIPATIFGGGTPSVLLTDVEEDIFRRAHAILDAIAKGTLEQLREDWRQAAEEAAAEAEFQAMANAVREEDD